jgi:hypothetical protein
MSCRSQDKKLAILSQRQQVHCLISQANKFTVPFSKSTSPLSHPPPRQQVCHLASPEAASLLSHLPRQCAKCQSICHRGATNEDSRTTIRTLVEQVNFVINSRLEQDQIPQYSLTPTLISFSLFLPSFKLSLSLFPIDMVYHTCAQQTQGSAFQELIVYPTFAPHLTHPYHVPGTDIVYNTEFASQTQGILT